MGNEVQYANSSGAYVAYQVIGEGSRDLLVVMEGFISVDMMDDEPRLARCMARLGSFARLIRFDRRGIGLSDPVSPSTPPTLEQWVEDADRRSGRCRVRARSSWHRPRPVLSGYCLPRPTPIASNQSSWSTALPALWSMSTIPRECHSKRWRKTSTGRLLHPATRTTISFSRSRRVSRTTQSSGSGGKRRVGAVRARGPRGRCFVLRRAAMYAPFCQRFGFRLWCSICATTR